MLSEIFVFGSRFLGRFFFPKNRVFPKVLTTVGILLVLAKTWKKSDPKNGPQKTKIPKSIHEIDDFLDMESGISWQRILDEASFPGLNGFVFCFLQVDEEAGVPKMEPAAPKWFPGEHHELNDQKKSSMKRYTWSPVNIFCGYIKRNAFNKGRLTLSKFPVHVSTKFTAMSPVQVYRPVMWVPRMFFWCDMLPKKIPDKMAKKGTKRKQVSKKRHKIS